MGASVALNDSTGDGSTVGASIRLSTPDKTGAFFGLTNHHVVGNAEEKRNKNGWLGPSHNLSRSRVLKTNSPSDYYHRCFQNKVAADVEYYRRTPLPTNDSRPKPPGLRSQLESRLEESQKALNASKSDRAFGIVYVASGWRLIEDPRYLSETIEKWTKVTETQSHFSNANNNQSLQNLIGQQKLLRWYIDWALIEVSPPRQIDPYNLIPHSMKSLQGISATAYICIDPERSYEVAKVGRSSGRTTGRINRVASVLNLRNDRSSIIPVDLVHHYRTVGLACGIVPSKKGQEFITGGDSGSVVFLDEDYGDEFTAYIAGLGFASNKATMVSYMVPFHLVVDDIEMVTGRRVVEPVWEGDQRGTTPDSE